MKTEVKKISSKGSSSLVEWTDDAGYIQRVILPTSELVQEDGKLFVNNPEEGIPYGVYWEEFISNLDPVEIAQLLRQKGIWTYEDYASSTSTVNSVFREVATQNLQRFQEAVRLQK